MNGKKITTTILILCFIGVAVFGILTMNQNEHMDGCLAATATGGVCPEQNPWQFFIFHFETFKSFSQTIFVSYSLLLGAILVAFTLIIILSFGLLINRGLQGMALQAQAMGRRFSDIAATSFRKKIIHWLALREKSPTGS